jgi:capsular polysaccharide biosynthesis protein
MELAQILVQLWRRRLAVLAVAVVATVAALALAYKISVFPPSLSHRTISNGTAETQVLVDYPRSSVGDLNRSFDPLVARAQVLSELMTTAPVVDRIAKIAGVPASAITTSTDTSTLNVPTSEVEPSANVRSNEITNERLRYRITFRAEPEQPVVTVFGQGPTAEAAMTIANAAAKGAAQWVKETQDQQAVPDGRRTQLTQLGAASGGVVNSGASRIVAALAFVAILGVGCLLILLVGNTLPAVRRANAQPAGEELALPSVAERRRVNGNGRTAKNTGAKAAQAGRPKTRAGRRTA